MIKRTFDLKEDLPEYAKNFYPNKPLTINSGVTVFTGCNGSGKTTLMNVLQTILNRKYIKCTKCYDMELKDIVKKHAFESVELASIFYSTINELSEGESINARINYIAKYLGNFVFNECKDEGWIFFDSLDSGLSIDNINDIINFIDNTIIQSKPKDLDLYIIIAANCFEFANHYECLDIYSFDHISFASYEKYKEYVLNTSLIKEKRYE